MTAASTSEAADIRRTAARSIASAKIAALLGMHAAR
jgi:hypothetical protein